MTSRESHPRDYRPIVIIAVAAAFVVNGLVVGLLYWLSTQRAQVELTEPILKGPIELCPGGTLDYDFTLRVSKAASIDLYTSVERTQPHDRVSYTRLQQFRFDGPTELGIERHWVMPPTYTDPVTGLEVNWLSGEYVQRTTAVVIGSREDDPPEISVPFTVTVGCGQ